MQSDAIRCSHASQCIAARRASLLLQRLRLLPLLSPCPFHGHMSISFVRPSSRLLLRLRALSPVSRCNDTTPPQPSSRPPLLALRDRSWSRPWRFPSRDATVCCCAAPPRTFRTAACRLHSPHLELTRFIPAPPVLPQNVTPRQQSLAKVSPCTRAEPHDPGPSLNRPHARPLPPSPSAWVGHRSSLTPPLGIAGTLAGIYWPSSARFLAQRRSRAESPAPCVKNGKEQKKKRAVRTSVKTPDQAGPTPRPA